MITGKKLIGAGAEKYLPFALSKLRQYAAAWTGSIKSHNFQVDDGTTIMIELYSPDRAQITIISLSGFLILGDRRTNHVADPLGPRLTELFMGGYKLGFKRQSAAWSTFAGQFDLMRWQQVQPVPNGEAIVALHEDETNLGFGPTMAVLHISKSGTIKTIFPRTYSQINDSAHVKVFCMGPSGQAKYRYFLLADIATYLSQDSGTTWTATTLPQQSRAGGAMRVGRLYGGAFVGNGTVLAILFADFILGDADTAPLRLYRTSDGITWEATNLIFSGNPVIAFVPIGNNRVLLIELTGLPPSVTATSRLSTDGGTTFGASSVFIASGNMSASTGVNKLKATALGVNAAAVLMVDPVLKTATAYFTNDAGVSWTARTLPAGFLPYEGPSLNYLAFDPRSLTLAATPAKLPGGAVDLNSIVMLFPVTEGTTVFAYYTTDGAQTWVKGGALARNVEADPGIVGDRGFTSIEALTKGGDLAFSNFYSNNGVLV